jgi:CRISPR-associated protein Cmr5
MLQNGLAQTLGFLRGKAGGDAESAEGIFFDHMATALDKTSGSLLAHVLQAELSEYLRLTRQAMAAAIWYKRFAQGVLGVDSTGENVNGADENGENAA